MATNRLLFLKHEGNIFKRTIENSNWRLITYIILLTLIGIVMIYSATLYTGSMSFVSKQATAIFIGLILFFILSIISYQFYQPYFVHIYIICIFLLILVLLFGSTYRNTKAWIDLKIFLFQPSEIVRILYILFLAGLIDKDYIKGIGIKKLFIVILSFLTIVFLLMLQPDFSGVVVYLPIMVTTFYLSGTNKKILNYIVLFCTTTIFLFLLKIYLSLQQPLLRIPIKYINLALTGFNIYFFVLVSLNVGFILFIFWILKKLLFRISNLTVFFTIIVVLLSYFIAITGYKFVKPYQQKRIIAFLNPYLDPTGSGYQVIQTKIAIGSGRLIGRGIFRGTQAKLGFVPEKHTDFIFSLIGEEFGFLGTIVVLILYLLLIIEGIRICYTSIDTYGSLLSAAITSMFAFYFFVNTGMCLGIFPVVGIPLPFVSYGGSNIVSSYIAAGILNSIYIRRFLY